MSVANKKRKERERKGKSFASPATSKVADQPTSQISGEMKNEGNLDNKAG